MEIHIYSPSIKQKAPFGYNRVNILSCRTNTMSETTEKKATYNPKEVEDKYYELCEERGYFEIDGNKGIQEKGKDGKIKTFSIMMPPPNVTGSLHIGHALTFTLQDIITRYKRMDGFKTLWQPGTDHAGIATQNIVEKQLLAEGTTKEA